jgi:hypothetical protein
MADTLVLTPYPDGEDVWGSHARTRVYDVTTSTTYPSGGYTVTPAMFGLTSLQGIEQLAVSTAGIWSSFAPTSSIGCITGGKWHLYSANGTELTGGVTAYVFRIRVIGT